MPWERQKATKAFGPLANLQSTHEMMKIMETKILQAITLAAGGLPRWGLVALVIDKHWLGKLAAIA